MGFTMEARRQRTEWNESPREAVVAITEELEFERSEEWGRRLSQVWFGALWGFAEATVFFLVPDLLISTAALFSPRRSFPQMAAVLIGTLLGGAVMYTVADQHPDEARSAVLSVPFIKAGLLESAERDMQTHGMWAMCLGAFSGVPYKTYAVAAPQYGPFQAFMAVSVPARLERFLLAWGIGALLGMLFRRQIESSPPATFALLTICWIGFYTYYWTVVLRIGR